MAAAKLFTCSLLALAYSASIADALAAKQEVISGGAIANAYSRQVLHADHIDDNYVRSRRQAAADPAQQNAAAGAQPPAEPKPDPCATLQDEVAKLKADLEGARQATATAEQQFQQANAEKTVLDGQNNQLRQDMVGALASKQAAESELSSFRTQAEAEKQEIRGQVQALQAQMEELERKYQEALETFPDLKRWFGKHIDTYVPDEVKSHAAKYNPLLETVTEKTTQYTYSLKDGLEQRLSSLMPERIGGYAPLMAWVMTYGVFLIPMVACFFIFFKVTTTIPIHKILVMCHLFYAIFFAILFVNTVILGQDALLVEADAYHDAVESMLFMMGMGYIFSATLQTYQLLTLRRSNMLAVVSYAAVICFQYLSLGFMYRFMWRLLARGDRWHWPAKHIYLLMSLMYTSFVILVAYVRDGSTPSPGRRGIQDMANESTVTVQMDTHHMEEGAARIAEIVENAAHNNSAAKQD